MSSSSLPSGSNTGPASGGLSPTTGCFTAGPIEPEPEIVATTLNSTEPNTEIDAESGIAMKNIRITLPRLDISKEDQQLLQRDLNKFIARKPEVATKLGLISDKSEGSLFAKMKADGKHISF
jgi:hypothetical protein